MVGHVVVHRRHGEVGAPDGAAGQAQAVERLRRRDLVDEVEVDVEEVGLAVGAADDVALPHLLGRASVPCGDRFCQPGSETDRPATKRHIVLMVDGQTQSRRRHRDPPGQPQQVRVRPRAARDPARPAPVLGDRLSRPTTASSPTPSPRTATRSTCSCCSRTRRSRAAGSGSAPIGVFWMEDEKGPDAKIICVPVARPASTRTCATSRRAPAAPARRDRALLRRLQDAGAGEEQRRPAATRAGTPRSAEIADA